MARRVEEDTGIDGARLRLLAKRLSAVAPAGRWWPYDSPFEVALSAVLVQRTRWEGAAQAMENLRGAGLLAPRALAGAPRATVERCLRPAGFFRQKARSAQGIARILSLRFGGSIERAFELEDGELRTELLTWPGVGEETADAILVFAAYRGGFVVDAYALRLMRRFGAITLGATPPTSEVARAWVKAGAGDNRRSRELHAAIVELCKSRCTRRPLCAGCPLSASCPRVGVEAPEADRP